MVMNPFLMIFRRFPTTFRRFSKIFQNCSEGQANVSEHFPDISEHFPKITGFVCIVTSIKWPPLLSGQSSSPCEWLLNRCSTVSNVSNHSALSLLTGLSLTFPNTWFIPSWSSCNKGRLTASYW